MSVMMKAKVFRNGNSQAIRLPREFQVNAKEVILNKVADVIAILPVRRRKGWFSALLKEIEPVDLGPRSQPGWTDLRTDSELRIPSKRRRRR